VKSDFRELGPVKRARAGQVTENPLFVRVVTEPCESFVMVHKLHPVIERLELFVSSRQRIVQELCLSCSIRRKEVLANVLVSLVVKID
jgi:hypothetical protein